MKAGSAGFRVVRLVFVAVGMLFLGRAAYLALSTASLLHQSIEVDGRIVAVVQMHKAIHTGLTYAPVFRFPLEDGRPFTVQSGVHANPPEFRGGERVKVYYQRGHPERAVIDSVGQLWRDDLALAFVGLIFVALGTILTNPRWSGRGRVVLPGDRDGMLR
jgi:hypothetical protein